MLRPRAPTPAWARWVAEHVAYDPPWEFRDVQVSGPFAAWELRVVHVRTGVVQSPRGGALRLQLPLFRLGLGGRLGSGRQWTSWVGVDDIVGIFHHALTTPDLHSPINGTAPHPVTSAEHARTLGRVLRRPALIPVPAIGPSLLLGTEAGEETAFADQRVLPARAEATGYVFRHRDLESALRHFLGYVST